MMDKFSKLIGVDSKTAEGQAAAQAKAPDICFTFVGCLLDGVTKARLNPSSPIGVSCCK
ncbi:MULTISPECIES: hypothetical protein [Paenibacillus]|uniref:hypothetical protein n=1 Tax=Paenibacillus TaxID=44249 RepID=UPI0012FA95E7|nr:MULTISPECIES: hypothetical protein [Paenibacillus]MBU7317090.1 hypothetical protein [Paenibacillus oleatilyticus]